MRKLRHSTGVQLVNESAGFEIQPVWHGRAPMFSVMLGFIPVVLTLTLQTRQA